MKTWLSLASLLLAISVMAGAFGAHALKDRLDPYLMSVYEKAVFYQIIHAIGILVVALLPFLSILSETAAARVCGLLIAGIFIFSGSLYILALTGIRWLGAITPIGGTAFIVAWLYLAYALWRSK